MSPTIITGPFADPPAPPSARFFEGYQWRFLFANIPTPDADIPSIGGITTTWCDGLLTNRQIALTLDQASVITAAVWPDDPRVNLLFPSDSTPLVAPNNRLLYAFRREGGTPKWVCRAAGLLLNTEDQADADVPLTHLTAYDPWKYLEGRPAMNANGELPGTQGFSWFATRGDAIICQLLQNTINGQGFCFVDAGVPFGGTAFYGGTIEATNQINFQVQQGTMVADAWTQLCDTGNLDIVLTPIYDTRRPGYTHELNIYKLAGAEKPSAPFSWDKLSRSATTIDRMHDGTPGNFVNIVQYFVGQGGFPAPLQTNPASLGAYLAYWSQQFFPNQAVSTGAAVLAMAQQALTLGKQGRRTTTLNPTPERSPIPFIDYDVGDRVPVNASSRLRIASAGYQRVQAIPITIDDDGIEHVDALLLSPDFREIAFL